MAGLTFKDVSKVYPGNVQAVKQLDLTIKDQEFLVLVGPSGCGKSTILRMVAGLEEITRGELYIDNELINNLPPKDRNIAMVFQDYALYPHMSVYDNLAFCLQLRKMSKSEIHRRVLESARILRIEDLLSRKPRALSGGQRQRVALGRAMVREPKVFLMDEPLSNLDAKLRVQTRTEIIKLHQKLKTTFIYVTHDQTEAMTMGDRIVILKDGVIQQVGSPQEVYRNPVNSFVAGFIGSPPMNLFDAVLEESCSEQVQVSFGGLAMELPQQKSKILKEQGYSNNNIIIGIRPEDIQEEQDLLNVPHCPVITANVEVLEIMGAESYLYFNIAGHNAIARVKSECAVQTGSTVKLAINTNKIHLFDSETRICISGSAM